MQLIQVILQPENMITLLVGFAVFGTILTLLSPYMVNDKLGARIKEVSVERDRLKAAQRAALMGSEVKLREKVKPGTIPQLVEALNLKKVFEAETSREKLRQAGLRSEKHLLTFLAARVIAPILFGIVAFVYASTVMATRLPPNMRIVVAVGGLILGFYIPAIIVSNLVTKRKASIKKAWSDALDLMLICIESGMALEPAFMRVAKEIGSQSVPLAEEMSLTVAELSYLQDRRKALDNLSKRTGLDTVKSVVTSLIQSERYGTPLGTALRVLAQENRNDRMAEAEKKAAALPPKLTVPMILFFLPVIFIVILGPSIIVVTGAK
jgi:tight adherence protein C